MLKQRVITALVLLGLLLPALFYPSFEPFAVLTLVLIVAAGWEWARLNGVTERAALVAGLGLGGVLALAWWRDALSAGLTAVWVCAGLVWVLLGSWMLRRGVAGWRLWPFVARLCGGLLLIAVAWLALVQARQEGVGFLLSLLSLVWTADIAAYFGGKAFGRRKLAPGISPGKSWEGVISGMLGVLLLGSGWLWLDAQGLTDQPSVFTRLWTHGPLFGVVAILCLCAMSVVGDLVESLVKRSVNMKDSSQLLPGHGGVLDRVDALLPVLPLAMMLASF
ncbi:MAG: phosphatidate cytidylyltransferase [Hydrogenophaga sp.]